MLNNFKKLKLNSSWFYDKIKNEFTKWKCTLSNAHGRKKLSERKSKCKILIERIRNSSCRVIRLHSVMYYYIHSVAICSSLICNISFSHSSSYQILTINYPMVFRRLKNVKIGNDRPSRNKFASIPHFHSWRWLCCTLTLHALHIVASR